MNITYIYRSILCWIDRGKHLQEWRDDKDISDMKRMLGYDLSESDNRRFWALFDNELGIENKNKLKQEVLKLHRKSLRDWKEQKPIKKESD